MIDTYHQLYIQQKKCQNNESNQISISFCINHDLFLSGYMIHKSQDGYNIDDFKKIQYEVKTIQEDTVLSYIKITDDRIPHNAVFLT